MFDLFDSGEGTESIQTAETSAAASAADVAVDSNDATAAPEQHTQTGVAVNAQQPGEASPQAAAQQSQATSDEPAAEEAKPEEAKPSADDLEREVETALADEKTPKWFKNAVANYYKPKLQTLAEQNAAFEPLAQYGNVEEIGQQLELLRALETTRINPQTNTPERTTESFVKSVYNRDPSIAYQLLTDLANLPSPQTEGLTVLHEILKQTGIDPTRLDEVKQFAANGYRLQAGEHAPPDPNDLALIPDHLKATFASLSPERRDALMIDDEHIRDAALEDAKLAQDAKRLREQSEQTRADEERRQKEDAETAFRNEIAAKGDEHFQKSGETVFTSFVDSLAKQANMSKVDSLGIANTVLNSFDNTLAGRQSAEFLAKEIGIQPDPTIPVTIGQLEENAKFIAYYERIGDRDNLQKSVAKQVELQERLIAKGNKIIAAVALKKANGAAQTIQTQNAQLDQIQTQTQRHAAAGVGSTIGSGTRPAPFADDFSDESYADVFRQSLPAGAAQGRG